MKVLVVSPHYDDAPLSLGQSMHDGWLSRQVVTVGVVFGASNWTVWFHPTRGRTALATPIRMAEEAHAAVRFRYRVRIGSHREVVLRLGTTDSSRFLDPTFDAAGDPELDEVVATLRRWSARYDAMVVPAGIGHHIDHTLCAAAGARLAADGRRVAFYEDRPYACGQTRDEIARHMATLDPTLRSVSVSPPMGTEKHRRLFYPSQFDDYFLDAIAADEAADTGENLWVSSSATWLTDAHPPHHQETR